MRRRTLAGLVLVLLIPLAGRSADQDPHDGTWVPEKAELAGKALPEEAWKSIQLVIEGDKYTVTVGKQVDKGTTKRNETAKPKEMDITGTDGPNKGKTFLAIYELTGDMLKVCYDLGGKERPKEFKTKEGTQTFLVVYKRAKK